MKRLVFLVEGDSELLLINNLVIPYLYQKGVCNSMNAQKIVTNRKLNKKGGVINYEYLKNDINRVLAQGNVFITTFLDFFRLPNSFPGYSADPRKIESIEVSILRDLNNHSDILPYIQLHEMEALMFSDISGFEMVVDDSNQIEQLRTIIANYYNPEDINNSPQTAPSKRLKSIFGYDKIIDGELIINTLGIEKILFKCPRFANWLNTLEKELCK